jgi:Amt family ammonium transporter
VSLSEEIQGLDIGEHGNAAYPDFVIRKPYYSFVGLTGSSEQSSESPEKKKREFARERS